MNIYKTALIALISMAITPLAVAQIYRCNGPDGPIFSDQECEPGAAQVELAETSGVSGVSDETKAELAQKKQARAEDGSSLNYAAPVNNQYNTSVDENPGRWTRGRINNRNNPGVRPPVARPPVARPVPNVNRGRRR
jgi:hypothetical protein